MSLKVTGRLFHNFGAGMESALPPYVVVECYYAKTIICHIT